MYVGHVCIYAPHVCMCIYAMCVPHVCMLVYATYVYMSCVYVCICPVCICPIYMCVNATCVCIYHECMCVYHMCVVAQGNQKRVLDPQELELQVVVSCLMRMLEPELGGNCKSITPFTFKG